MIFSYAVLFLFWSIFSSLTLLLIGIKLDKYCLNFFSFCSLDYTLGGECKRLKFLFSSMIYAPIVKFNKHHLKKITPNMSFYYNVGIPFSGC